jgi:F-type H+-transporting ATPase subunit epsilon
VQNLNQLEGTMMAGNILLEVVTPEKIVVSEDAQIVAAPGSLGEFGVLTGHTPFLTTLKAGIIRFTDTGGQEHYVFVSGGFTEALPDKVTVLAESAERRRDIDIERAKAALERAEKRLVEDRSREDVDFARAKAALERAAVRIRLKAM